MQTKPKYYIFWSVALLIVEILIGSVLKNFHWLRAYGGDILVIPLIYCLIRIFIQALPRGMPFLVCCIGFLAEFLQYIHLAEKLGFEKGSLGAIIIGTSFSWWDVLCYIAGMVLIYVGMDCRKKFTQESNS